LILTGRFTKRFGPQKKKQVLPPVVPPNPAEEVVPKDREMKVLNPEAMEDPSEPPV
jgi:hypothetical protein